MNVYERDPNNQEILLSHTNQQVMMEWEKPYMEASIDFLKPKGDVLEIGFGFGYSASQILKHKPRSYTIIECDPIVIARLNEWANNYPDIPINIVEGRWQEKLDTLGKFHEIYFDDYPLDTKKDATTVEMLLTGKRWSLFIDMCIRDHTYIGSRISFYLNRNSTEWGLGSDSLPFIETDSTTMEIAIPENCEYRNIKEQECTIPLITKIKEYSFGGAQEWALQQMMKGGYTPHATK